MGLFLKQYIDKLFGGDISEMPEEEFAAKVAEIEAEPVPEPAAAEEIPSGLSPKEMWEVYGVSHVRWETAGAYPCEGCKKMDGAIYDHHMGQMVDDRRHVGCSCRWVPLYVIRGRQQKECSLPDAPHEAFQPDFGDLLTRIHEAEKLFPGYTPPVTRQFNPNDPFNHGPAKVLGPKDDVSDMNGYYLIECIDKTEQECGDPALLISLLEVAESKRISQNTKAKVCKRRGELLLSMHEDEKALAAFQRALEYNPKAAVKRRITEIKKRLSTK